MEMGADVLRMTNPLPIILQAITDIQGLSNHREYLYTILTEMYSNALEHGILGLESSLKQDSDGSELEVDYRWEQGK